MRAKGRAEENPQRCDDEPSLRILGRWRPIFVVTGSPPSLSSSGVSYFPGNSQGPVWKSGFRLETSVKFTPAIGPEKCAPHVSPPLDYPVKSLQTLCL
jgi:hypothetical protein